MKEYSLTLAEVLNLEIEINGHFDQASQTQKIKGILNQPLNLVAKYWITKLAKTVTDEKTKIDEIRNDLIKKYGVADESGQVTIKVFTDDAQTEINPAYQDFTKELGTLLAEKVTISYVPIKLSQLVSIETNETYATFYNFVDENQ